jgi:hypothetical protein
LGVGVKDGIEAGVEVKTGATVWVGAGFEVSVVVGRLVVSGAARWAEQPQPAMKSNTNPICFFIA